MRRFTLCVLGPPELRDGERLLTFRSRKALALLVYLAIEGRRVSRDELAALLWPDTEAAHARALLRSTLNYVRQALRAVEGGVAPAVLLVEGSFLGLERAAVELDVETIAQALVATQHIRADWSAAERKDALQQLHAAVATYRGDVLAGFTLADAPEFDAWVSVQRTHWQQQLTLVFKRLLQIYEAGGELAAARDVAAQWIAHDQLNEEAYRCLIQLHATLGERTAALRAYETYADLLARELHAAPAADLTALVERLRAVASTPRAVPEAATALAPERPLDVPFVGRVAEYARLVQCYEAAIAGRTHLVVITGKVGMGKTRLAWQFVRWAQTQGADVLVGSAFDTVQVAYGPLMEAFRPRLERERALDDLLADVWLTELSRLLPELRDRLPDLLPSLPDETTARARLLESIARLGEALARQAPVVLFIDDAQWADTATRDALLYAARQWATHALPVLVLLTVRHEDLVTTPALAEWLAMLQRVIPLTHVTLDLLAVDAVRQLVAQLAGNDGLQLPAAGVWETFGTRIHTVTGGFPLAIVELLTLLRTQGVLQPAGHNGRGWSLTEQAVDVPIAELQPLMLDRLRETIQPRYARLQPATRELLGAAAAVGGRNTFDVLMRVAGLTEDAGLAALEEALRQQVLVEHTEGAYREPLYVFRHDNIRDIVYTLMGAARRRVTHRRALDILREAGAPVAILARHARLAGETGAAFAYHISAGDAALAVHAVYEALGHYETARRLLEETPDGPPVPDDAALLERLYSNSGRACEMAERWDAAYAAYAALRALGQRRQRPELECIALNRLAILAMLQAHDVRRATDLLRTARAVAEGHDDRTLVAETEWNLAHIATLGWERAAAFDHGQRALALARDLGDTELVARCLQTLGEAAAFAGRWEESIEWCTEARHMYAALQARDQSAHPLVAQFIFAGIPTTTMAYYRAMEALCLRSIAVGAMHLGNLDAGIDAGRTALALSRALRSPFAMNLTLISLAHGLDEAGAYAEAHACAHEAIETSAAITNPQQRFWALLRHGITYQHMLHFDAAHMLFEEAQTLADQLDSPVYRLKVAAHRCVTAALQRDWSGAHRAAREAAELRSTMQIWLLLTDFGRQHEITALLHGGDADLARTQIRCLEMHVGHNRRFQLVLMRMQGVLAQWEGDLAAAGAYFRAALALAEELCLPGEQWQIAVALGAVYAAQPDETQAQQAYARAASIIYALADGLYGTPFRETFLAAAARIVPGISEL